MSFDAFALPIAVLALGAVALAYQLFETLVLDRQARRPPRAGE